MELFDPSNFSVEVYNAFSPETKEFLKSTLDEHLNSLHQAGPGNNAGNGISEDIDEPDYVTIEDIRILNKDSYRVENLSVNLQNSLYELILCGSRRKSDLTKNSAD